MTQRLSGLILAGAKLRPGHREGYFVRMRGGRVASCAQGAAAEALGYHPEAFIADDSLERFFRQSAIIRDLLADGIGYSILAPAPLSLVSALPGLPDDWRSVHTTIIYLNQRLPREMTAHVLAEHGLRLSLIPRFRARIGAN